MSQATRLLPLSSREPANGLVAIQITYGTKAMIGGAITRIPVPARDNSNRDRHRIYARTRCFLASEQVDRKRTRKVDATMTELSPIDDALTRFGNSRSCYHDRRPRGTALAQPTLVELRKVAQAAFNAGTVIDLRKYVPPPPVPPSPTKAGGGPGTP
jgi:hypothetical protein